MKILKLLILFILFHSSNSACPRPDPLQNGTSFGCLSEGGQYQFFCDQGYSIRGPITRLCVNGDWSGTQPTCEISLGGELSEGDVRFDPEYQIIPNFNYQGTFYRSCWNDYSIDFANLLCYVAGRVGAVSVHRIDLDFGIEVSGPYVTADNITCVGNEEHFSECTFGSIEISPDCSDGVLGISCFPYATMTHDFTLDRIRMYYDNDTLDVCSNSIDQQTADIYCKLLGKLGGATMTSVNATQVGSEVVTKVVCLPSMRNFGDCVVTLNDSCVDGFMKIECRETDVENSLRLTGAVDLHTGKLQIYKAGSWGDICWEAFYSTEAEVACRQLGFETFLAAPKGIYGDREGDSYAVERVKCPVDATNYSSCQFLTESRCNDPDEAVSIWCINRTGCCIPFNNSSLLRTNSTKPGLIPHGEVLRYSCIGNSVVSGSSELMCEGGIWSSVPPQCIDATENSIRLIDGSSAKEGNIQIFQNGKWNFVCDRNWDLEVGTRKCEDLGYEGALEVTKFNYFNSTSGQQNSSLECNITNCTTQSDCAISEAAGVICGNLQFEVRLVGPNSNETAGRVQVFFNGAWIEVCQRYLSIFSRVGPTVCNQLGYTFNSEYDHEDRSEIYGEPVGNTTIDLLCLGDNDNIGECSHSISECDNQGLYLVCTPPETGTIRLVGSDNPYEGIVEIYQEYSWKSICQQNWDDTDGRIVCKELGWDYLQNIGTNYGPAVSPIGFGITNVGCYGNETTLSECPYLTDTSDCDRGNPATVTCGIPSQFQVQLRDTTDNINNISGRVVVYVDRNWIGVCDDDWGFPDALVVCRSLGYNFTINAIAGYSTITADRGWNYVNCVGNETSFGDCEYRNTTVSSFFFASCYRSEGAGVTCGNYVDYDIKIREDTLKIGDLITGIVEIRYEGEWYPICSKNDNISEYLCEVLGYGNASVPITSSEEIITDFSFNNFTCTGDQSISQCLPEPGPKVDCPSGKPVQISCINNDGRVRLLDGNKTAGHVQIFHAGRWGDVCDDLWGIEDANVVCRQLFQRGALKAILYSQFGTREADFLLDNVRCVGTEERLADCPSNGWGQHNCGGYELAGVQCLPEDCPLLDAPQNGSVDQNVSHGGYATFSCDNGYKLNGLQTVRCLWSTWDGSLPDCITANEGDIQLVDGPTSFEGHIQIFHAGEWGYICDDSWDNQDGRVVCSQLGYAPNFKGISTSSYYPTDSGVSRIWLDGVNCVGNESILTECNGINYNTHDCSVNEYAGVECFADEGSLRLIDGTTDLNGLLQIYENGTWHYFCHFQFVGGIGPACTQLGFQTTGSSTSAVVNTTEFKSLFCLNNNIPLYPNCLLEHVTNCFQNFAVNLTCTINDRCAARLYGAEGSYKGLVEFWRDGRWGGVCNGGFTLTEANVLCQQLGWTDGALNIGYDVMTSGAIPFHFQNVTCSPGEVDICNCAMDTDIHSKCTRNEAVYVECNVPADGTLRLLEGEDEYSGVLEVFHLGRWGAVCDDSWATPESEVACKQLGAKDSISYRIRSAIYSEVWLDNVKCTGDELFLSNCSHNEWGDHNCRGLEGIFLQCLPFAETGLVLTDIKYADDDLTARVRIRYQDIWYNICPNEVTPGFANQLCTYFKLEDMPNVSMALELEPPAGSTESIVLVSCPYEFDNLTDCVGGVGVCPTDKVLGIKCLSLDNQTRLITTTGFSGLLEINHEGSWRGICDDGWDIRDATVACRQLGFTGAIRAISSLTKEFISFWLTIVNCEGYESYLDHCPFRSWDVSNCYRNEYAGVVCIPNNCTSLPTILNGEYIGNTTHGSTIELVCNDNYVVRGSRTLECINSNWIGDMPTCVLPQEFGIRLVDTDDAVFYKGHVQVYHLNQWGYICDTTWDDKDGETACRQLGFQGFQRITKQSFHPNAVGMSWTENVNCQENDYSLAECELLFYDSLRNCSNEFAGVICTTLEGQVELINGTMNNTGWVRVYTQGRYRPVCYDNFGPPEVSVICKQLGYAKGEILDSGQAAIQNSELTLDCDGSEDSVLECVEFEVEASSCYRVDAYINCTDEDIYTVRLVEGEYDFDGQVEVYLEEGWSSVCYTGIDNDTAAVLCNALGWEYGINSLTEEASVTELGVQVSISCEIPDKYIQACVSINANCSRDDALNIQCNTPPQNTLRRGHNNALEIFHDMKWGYICDDSFDKTDANVACRHLGYPSATSFRIAVEVLNDFFWLDNLLCSGNEVSLADCTSNEFGFENCYAREGVDVTCAPHYDGTIKFEGDIPLIFLDNAFHYICADAGRFTIHSASVICNQVGLVRADSVGNTSVGANGLQLYPDVKFIACFGEEENVTDCQFRDADTCAIVGNLKCTDPTGLIRLIGRDGDTSPTNGTVQIHNGADWQYICADKWSYQDANIACTQLGFTTVSSFSSITVDKEGYTYFGTEFDCYGTETKLIDCYHIATSECDIDEVATLSCKDLFCPQYSSINSCGSKCSETCYQDIDTVSCPAVCLEKCECFYDYIWNTTQQDVCIQKRDCPNYCTENEHYHCVPACQYNCDTYKDPPFNFCNLLACTMGCGCKDGYVRRHGTVGECVLEADCEATTQTTQTTQTTHSPQTTVPTPTPTAPCPINSQYSNCSTACPANCSSSSLDECILKCVSGCQCNAGFVLFDDYCIEKEKCPVDNSIEILTDLSHSHEASGPLRLFTQGNWFNICSNSIEIESIRLIEFTCDFLNYSNTQGNIFMTETYETRAVVLNCPEGAETIEGCTYTLSGCDSILYLECVVIPTLSSGFLATYIGIGIGAVFGILAIIFFFMAVLVMIVIVIRRNNQFKSRLLVASDVPDTIDDPTEIPNPMYQAKDLEAEQLIKDDDDDDVLLT